MYGAYRIAEIVGIAVLALMLADVARSGLWRAIWWGTAAGGAVAFGVTLAALAPWRSIIVEPVLAYLFAVLGLYGGAILFWVLVASRPDRFSEPAPPCPHGHADWDECPVCCH